jgi:hypothetical protein
MNTTALSTIRGSIRITRKARKLSAPLLVQLAGNAGTTLDTFVPSVQAPNPIEGLKPDFNSRK